MKEVRFYCESCGSHVRPRDKICKKCGSFFSQVRCPACSYQADVKEFMKGCPVCGYAGTENPELLASSQRLDSSLPEGFVEIEYPFEKEKSMQGIKVNGFNPLTIVVAIGALVFTGLAVFYIFSVRGGL